ncbi:MAG: acyl-CoA thioesterase [Burkholderiales bacterium]|nr:acyl-CoA thioesterase [Burkholderiales bacterium]
MSDPRNNTRADYRHFLAIQTRWMDNDAYGHVNNVVYYSYFDTAVNEYLMRVGGFDFRSDPVIDYVVETSCRFFRPLAYPETIEAGMRVARLGRTSVTYEIALFRGGEATPAAAGRFVQVWVERRTQAAAEIPARIRLVLEPLVAGG